MTDGYDNYYHVVEGTVRTQVAEQQSLHEKTRAQTSGVFASAWIDHGQAPKGSSYEYMVLIQPDASQLKRVEEERGYRVLRRDDTAHVVFDETTRITAYAAFEAYQPQGDELLQSLPAEVLVMHQPDKDYIRFSVCDPNLNILEKEYTTKEPSRPIEKIIVLKGGWKVVMPQEQIRVVRRAQQTELTVRLQHGQPIECLLQAF